MYHRHLFVQRAPVAKELRPDHFKSLLLSLSKRSCVLVCVVDLFDFHGSLIPDLPRIVHPDSSLMLIANKVEEIAPPLPPPGPLPPLPALIGLILIFKIDG